MGTTKDITDRLERLQEDWLQVFRAQSWNVNQPMSQIFGNGFPISAEAISGQITRVCRRIISLTVEELEKDGLGAFLSQVPTMCDALAVQNLPHDARNITSSLLALIQIVAGRLPPDAAPKPKVDWEDVRNGNLLPKDLLRRLRAVEARLSYMEPLSVSLSEKIEQIESAHAAAEQLPTDLQELERQRSLAEITINEIISTLAIIRKNDADAQKCLANLEESKARLDVVVLKSEQALRGATGVGLAAAFEQRRSSLAIAGALWTFGLAVALTVAVLIGADRVASLKDVLVSDRSATVIWVNAILALMGIAAPVWFSWISTKQIWSNFKLSEDYAFKASVSRAYEGYRAEAISLDPALQARLFASALTRLEEAPIRLLEAENHGSPLQELLSNPSVRATLENIPGIAEKIVALIPGKGGAAALVGTGAAAAGAAAIAEKIVPSVDENDAKEAS